MFNDISIVTTAISSFNNAALYSPYFLIVALFTIPLFAIVFLCGRDVVARFGWNNSNIESKVGFWGMVCLLFWLLLVGGNYAVIRDSISLLPMIIAGVLFVSMIFITNCIKRYDYFNKMYTKRSRLLLFIVLLLLAAFSAMPNWWGILLQLSAIICGMIVGDRLKKNIPDILVSCTIMGIVSVLLLMQPEYFRFGQLGRLTFLHIAALLLTGFFCITTLVTKYTNSRSGIYNAAYIKLKWLFRIMSLLALILFVLTESVPIFIGLMAVCAISEMLTVYHSKNIAERIYRHSWALFLISFGIITICPCISMLGVIFLAFGSSKVSIKDFTNLL